MKIAQEIFVKVRGELESEYVDILNNLAVLSLDVRSNVIDFLWLSPVELILIEISLFTVE